MTQHPLRLAHAPPRTVGFTLVEMLVVLAILGVLLGLGAGLLSQANKGLGLAAGVNLVASSLRLARNKAMTDHAPCWLLIDPAERSVRTLGRQTIGLWHLEDKEEGVTTGAFGRNGAVQGASLIPGRAGQALLFAGAGCVTCDDFPRDPSDAGLVLEAWCLLGDRPGGVIVRKGDEYGLRLTSAGRLRFDLGAKRLDSGSAVPLHRWFHVEAIYDGAAASLYVNEEPVADEELTADLPVTSAPLTLSDAQSPFQGALDEVRVSALVLGEERRLPSDCAVDSEAPIRIRFDPRGRLSAPVTVTLKAHEESQSLTVGILGVVE
ncbi:MAG: LamG domain-containing protein [Planctomycetes bacterium]|nr:LamG domain-containing protein [Planctomycetota bacterium]